MLRFVFIQPTVCSASRSRPGKVRTRNEERAVRYRMAVVSAVFVASALLTGAVSGQDAATARLMDQPPFDVLTLDKANDSKVYKVHPVRLPNRRVPEKPRPTESIRVKMMENDEEYDVAWANIAKLDLYEQLVLAEVNKLAAQGNLEDAYDEQA